jgi:hypothetical protein
MVTRVEPPIEIPPSKFSVTVLGGKMILHEWLYINPNLTVGEAQNIFRKVSHGYV